MRLLRSLSRRTKANNLREKSTQRGKNDSFAQLIGQSRGCV